jgi:hypothetical protein
VGIEGAGFMLVLAAILHKMLPESHPTINVTYPLRGSLFV